MDLRQYDLYIDGRRLPSWFLTDADTQFGIRADFIFDGWVERFDATQTELGPDDVFAPWVAPFAQLHGHRLAFRLVRSSPGFGDVGDSHYVVARLVPDVRQGSLQVQVQGQGNEVLDFQNLWWEVESGETYVVRVDYEGTRTQQMTVQARRCRVPLRDLSRWRLNR
jgi:hypothetical protein